MGKIYGYARVSSKDQNEIRQIIALREIGVNDKDIFIDKQSGKDFDRKMYQQLVGILREKDILYIQSLDRLGRNYEEIIEQWKYITKEKKADIVIIDMPLLDTRKGKELIEIFMTDVVLALLSYVSETERINIRKRQQQGIAAAKARGVHFGRKKSPLPVCFDSVYRLYKQKKITVSEAAKRCNMARSTFYERASSYELAIND